MSSTDKAQQNFDQAKVDAEKNLNQAKDTAEKNIEQAKANAGKNIEQAKENVKQTKQTLLQKLEDDGVVNPTGLAFLGFSGVFFAAIPVTSWLAQPNGFLERGVNGVVRGVSLAATAGATSSAVPQTGKIAALAALYVATTFAVSGAGSAAAVASAFKEGRSNKHPRAQFGGLRGLPLRLYSAHANLMEMFPGWAIVAALTQAIAPGDQSLINLLGLHVISKVFLYYPAYIFNQDSLRSLAHVTATASVINVALKLAKRPLL